MFDTGVGLGQGWPLCSQTDPELFFPESTQPTERDAARGMCAMCPARVRCLALCFDSNSVYGIWGGILQSHRETYHVEFHRTRPDSIAFARKVIREVDALYGTPAEHEQARIDARETSKYRTRERERRIRDSKRAQLDRAS